MLRYQLYECNVGMISIEKEINYIRNYITLQQIRKPENLSVE
jgi:two-component system LytT family sensor kinase